MARAARRENLVALVARLPIRGTPAVMERRSLGMLAAALVLGGLAVFLLRGRRAGATVLEAELPPAPPEVAPEAPTAGATESRRAVVGEVPGLRTIRANVHDLEKAPIVGARVQLTVEAGPAEAVTGEDGLCAFDLQWQEWFDVEATATGHLGWKERMPWRDSSRMRVISSRL